MLTGHILGSTRTMRQPIISGLVILALLVQARQLDAQTGGASNTGPYSLTIAVDEVSLTFHAADAHGLPVNDLKLDELTLWDNGRPPHKILAFQSLENFPIRAGILMDTSQSMEASFPRDRAISIRYAQQILRQQTDQAFVMDFGYVSKIVQPWTSDPSALTAGIRDGRVTAAGGSGNAGTTALFTAIYQACLNQFGRINNAASGNFILLFSDGEDNASRASFKDAVDMCRRANTAIYAFRAESKSGFSSTGPKTLAELASESGGRVFFDDDTEPKINDDLRIIEADLRNQYRLVYKPAEWKHDGTFHRVELKAPDRVDSITVRSGYYAPAH
jgi:Ca-activated chloride channel homolog